MSAVSLEHAVMPRRVRVHRVIRALHLWIGAWGALAAILFGTTGFLQNHRSIMSLPQGESTEVSHVELPVPEDGRASPRALSAWLEKTQHISLEPQARRPEGGQNDRERGRQPADRPRAERSAGRWMLSAGNARVTTQAEYVPGGETVTLRTSVQSPLGIMSHLHKGVGGGAAWIFLSDSFAVSMVALGVSGLLMWGRDRTARKMIFSTVVVAVVVLAIVGGSAIL